MARHAALNPLATLMLLPATRGYRLSAWQRVCAPTGPEGFCPAFLSFARTGLLSRSGGAQDKSIRDGPHNFVVTGRAATILVGRIPWQQQRRQSNQALKSVQPSCSSTVSGLTALLAKRFRLSIRPPAK